MYIAEADVRQERVLKDKNHIISMKVTVGVSLCLSSITIFS